MPVISQREHICEGPLIAFLSYGGVPKEYFLDVLSTGLIDAHGVLSNKRAALRGSFSC